MALSEAEELELLELEEAEYQASLQKPKEESAPKKKSSILQTALESYGKGATAGYLPQIQAAAEKVTTPLFNLFTGNDVETDDYVTARDKNIARQKKQAEDNPATAFAGEIGGNIATGAMIPGGALLKATSRFANPWVNLAGTVAKNAAAGAGVSALSNPGDVEGVVNPLQLGERIENAGIGAVTGGALPVAGKIGRWGADKLRDSAATTAFMSLGPYARDIIQNTVSKTSKATGDLLDRGEAKNIGRTLLDTKAITAIPRTFNQLTNRIGRMTEGRGKGLKAYTELLDMSAPGVGRSRKSLSDEITQDLFNPNIDLAGVKKANASFARNAENFTRGGLPEGANVADELLTFPNLRQKKIDTGKAINWDRLPGADIPLEEQFNRSAYKSLARAEDKAAEEIETLLFPKNVGKHKSMKKSYGNLKEATEIVKNRALREQVKRQIADSVIGGGLAGSAALAYSDDPETRLAALALGAIAGPSGLGKFVRTGGRQMSAKAQDTVGKALNKTIKSLEKNPWGAQMIFNSNQEE